MFLQRRRCVSKRTPNFNRKNLQICVQIFLNVIWGSASYLEGSCFQGFQKCWDFRVLLMPAIVVASCSCPPPFCFVHIIASWLCANLRVVAPPCSRMCLKATRGGNNLFGKYGPNACVSVWVLFCSEVGLHVDLNFGLILVRIWHIILVFVGWILVWVWPELVWGSLNLVQVLVWILSDFCPNSFLKGLGWSDWSEFDLTLVWL